MGGYGSGRRWSSRNTTDDYLRIDVRFMQSKGFLKHFASGSLYWSSRGERIGSISFRTEEDRVLLSYKNRERGQDWESLEYPVRLNWTPCHFGGKRPWFLCPARGCGKRVGFLYGGRIYACRDCHRLAYPCQRESASDRACRRAERIGERLGGFDSIFEAAPLRPKGMHQRTYERLAARYDICRYDSFRGIARKLQTPIEQVMDMYQLPPL